MPRKPDPSKLSKKEKTNLRNAKLHRFLPCFFDVPACDVQEILGISHHTLDPARRALGLQKWPFMDVCRNKFCMNAEEIYNMREKMMPLADEEMQGILQQMSIKADESRNLLAHKKQLSAMRKNVHGSKTKKSENALNSVLNEELGRLIEDNLQMIRQYDRAHHEEGTTSGPHHEEGTTAELDNLQLQELIDNASITNDTQFWNEISQLLGV